MSIGSRCSDFSSCSSWSPEQGLSSCGRWACSMAYRVFPNQGSNPCPWHWQADAYPPCHQGSPFATLDSFSALACTHVYMRVSRTSPGRGARATPCIWLTRTGERPPLPPAASAAEFLYPYHHPRGGVQLLNYCCPLDVESFSMQVTATTFCLSGMKSVVHKCSCHNYWQAAVDVFCND